MTDSFDPYLKWLGIRNHQTGINHYRLLGLELFESDVDAISSAAERQIRHVESVAVGEHEATGKRIIAELRLARNCLLDPTKRSAYDQTLGKKTESFLPAIDTHDHRAIETPTIEIGSGAGSGAVPAIRTRRKRQKRKAGFDVAGWLLGAVGAVVFAYVILNTDLIEKIKGIDSSTTVEEIKKGFVQPKDDSDKRRKLPTEDAAKKSSTDNRIANKKFNTTKKADRKVRESRGPKQRPGSNVSIVNKSRTNPRPKKLAVPEQKQIELAVSSLRETYRAQFSDNSQMGKTRLAELLLNKAIDDERPVYVWALAKTSMGLAADVGNLSELVSAAELVRRKFDYDYWSFISDEATRCLGAVRDFEVVSSDVAELLIDSREAGELEFCQQLASSAARVAKKNGDKKQTEMLTSFSQDMNSLTQLRREYEKLKRQNKETLSKSNNLLTGRYLCYVLQDWKNGLPYISNGSDSAFAAAAKVDLNSKENHTSLVVNQWMQLAMKPKYKGLDRRCMLERVEHKVDVSLNQIDAKQIRHKVLEHIQVVKKFINDPTARTRTVGFGVLNLGNQKLGPVFFERAKTLTIGPKKEVKISARKKGDSYVAEYGTAGLQFKIRFMDNGWAEMRVKGKRSNFFTIWYGK